MKAQHRLREKIGNERFERLLEDMAEVLTALRDAGDAEERSANE